MEIKAVIFDLDGTLLDTLPDLTALTNAVMDARGYPRHTSEEVLTCIGDGARMLLRRAVPPEVPDADLDDLMRLWRDGFSQVGYGLTKPYPGIREALAGLRRAGLRLGVLSNKFDAAATDTIDHFFPGVFDVVRGEGPGTPRKPDPTGLRAMLAELQCAPDQAALVGDSAGTDMAAAVAAGVLPIGVSWGYNDADVLWAGGAQIVVDQPGQLLTVCTSACERQVKGDV